jgi:hypothetical protein
MGTDNYNHIEISELFLRMYFECNRVEIGNNIDLHFMESQYKIILYRADRIFIQDPLSPNALNYWQDLPQEAKLHIVMHPFALAPQYFNFLEWLLEKVNNPFFQSAVINYYQLQEQIRVAKKEIALIILRKYFKEKFQFMCETLFTINVCRKWVYISTEYEEARISISSYIEISIFNPNEWSMETVIEYDLFLFRIDKNEDLLNRVNQEYLANQNQ